MKKLLTFLTLLTLSIGVTWAADRWVQTAPSDLVTGDVVVIAEAVNKFAMTNNNGTSNPPSAVSYSLNDALEISSEVTTTMQWIVTVDNGSLKFGSGTNYLYCTNANNGVRVGTNTNNSFVVKKEDTTYPTYQQLYNTATSRYVGVYNKEDWRCYTSINNNIKGQNIVFYKKVSSGSTTETCATPTFSPVAGTYYEPQSVTLSCTTPGSTIYYTTDGSDPTTSSTQYTSAIPVSETTTIKAIATADGMDPSPVASATYTIDEPTEVELNYENTLISSHTDFYIIDRSLGGLSQVWKNSSYGITANGQNRTDEVESWLYSPVFDATSKSGYTISLDFEENLRYFASTETPTTQATLWVREGTTGAWQQLAITPHANVDNNNFHSIETIDLSAYAGKKFQLAFKYVADMQNAPGRWELKNLSVTATKEASTDLYILGMVNGNGERPDQGVKMTYDGNNYNAKIWVIGNSSNAMGVPGTWFAFTTVLAENNDNGGWGYVNQNRYSPTPSDGLYYWLNSGANEGALVSDEPLTKQNNDNAFLIPAGLYEITVSGDLSKFSLTSIKNLKPTITPEGGEVLLNSTATIALAEDFNDFIGDCNPVVTYAGSPVSITAPVATLFVNGTAVESTSSEYTFSTTGEVTLTGKGALVAGTTNYAEKETSNTFNVTEVTGDVYTLVTSESDLVAGEEYLIVGSTSTSPYSAILGPWPESGNYATAVKTNFVYDATQNTITLQDGCTATPLTLEGSTGAWTFNNGNGFLAYTSTSTSSNNYLWTVSSASDNGATWTINTNNLPSSNALIVNVYNTSRKLQFNGDRFAGYTGSQSAVALFKKATASNKSATPTITPASGDVKGGSVNVTISAAEGATIYYTTNGDVPTTSSATYSGEFTLTGAAGTSVTVKAIAVESGKDASAVASATYTFVAPSRPTFSPASGTSSTSAINVTIESADNGTIYYVINPETAPTAGATVVSNGTEYSSAINLSEVGTYTIYAAVSVNGIVSSVQSATYTITSSGGGEPTGDGDYVKVTSDANLTDGEYLIVYEGDGFEDGPYAFNGALSTLDAASNYISVEINDYTIPSSETVDAAVFTFNAAAGTFVNSNGVYIGASSNANTITTSTDPLTNTVSIDEDHNAVIMGSGGAYLRYNANDGRFRYYKSSSYSSQQPIALYKKVASASVKAPIISPEGGTFLNSQYPNGITVTVTPVTEGSTIHVSTDGTNYTSYTAVTTLTVTGTTTVSAYATKDDLTSETVSETYNLVDVILEDVQFSPIPGTYSGSQTLQMYTTNQNAKIYYEISDAGEPNNPTTSSTLYSSTDVINLEPGHTYHVKAIAYVGNNSSEIAEGTYTINTASTSGLNSIAALNEAATGNTKRTMNNPVQVIYMSTWRHKDGTNNEPTIPEYAYIRDNTGYSLVYFGNGWYNTWDDAVDNPKICEMGDWIPAGVLKGAVQVWSDGFHNELGGRNNATTITGWPTATDELKNTPIIPEEMTNTNINAGWSAPASFATTFNAAVAEYVADNNISDNPDDWTSAQESAVHAYAAAATNNEGYIKYVEDGNVWGHYVHLRKNTIRVSNTNVAGATDGDLGENGTRKKYSGFITDQSGDELTYYDSFYNFSGFNGTPDYSNDFFQNIQNNGGTFDVYGIVGFYGPKAADEESSYSPFELFPIDFLYIYKPTFNITSGTYYDTQEVTLSCATEGATIWYKTSDMEDYVLYDGTPITVDATTTIETYSSIPTKYNDVMESVVNTLIINMGNIPQPVISPASGVFTVGEDERVDATIAFEDGATVPEGTVIYFTVDGSDPKDENSNRYEYTAENIAQYLTDIEQTTTVRAIAYLVDDARQTSYYSREAEAKTYTFVKTNGIVYTLVTDQTQLNESSVYVIVNKANHMAMSVAQNDNNRGATGVKFVDEATKTQVEGNGDVALFMLTKIGNKWYIKTNNSDANGYLAVGDGNLLLTNAAADDNAEATITIDADAEHQAHISFAYNNALTRYLRYWLGGQAFSTYTSETSNLPVSLYYLAATPLANIEKEGTIENGKNQYTIADQLIGVWADATHGVLWCKDQGDASIDKTYIKDGQVDFMKHSGVQAGEWDQSNWVALQFTTPNSSNNIDLLVSSAVGKYIKQATVQGYYVDDVNFTIRMAEDKLELVEPGEVEYTKNVYCTTNFLPENLNIWGSIEAGDGGYTIGNDQNYFFMNPKIQEVCHITWAQWDKAKGWFTVPTASGFDGAFQVGWMYNQGGNISSSLRDEVQYEFDAIVQRASKTAYGPKDKVTTPNSGITVLPLNLSANSIVPVTAINTVSVNGEVKSVKYVNVAGVVSDKPFSGVNIVVTEYTDGSRSTNKMLRK